MEYTPNRRILVIDDNTAIHADFKKTLVDPAGETEVFADAEAALFDDAPAAASKPAVALEYQIDFAAQGREGHEMLRAAVERGEPYALAFVDVRMPPGWDGVETIAKLWKLDPELQAVICTAFADYSWQEMIDKLGRTDRLLILKKPFDPIEVRQLASALTEKWNATRREKLNLRAAQTAELEARAYAASLETVNRALETSRQAAEANSNAKAELLLNMAQNLFAPVDAMLDVAEKMSTSQGEEEEWLENLGNLCRGGGHLRRSLQDVLDLTELEAGSLRLEPSPFSPRELVQSVINELRWKAAKHSLAMEFECAPALPTVVESDVQRIRQILMHLLDNAIEHTPAHGFVRLLVFTRQTAQWQEPQLCIEVIDSGPGLTRDQSSLIFEPFCHASNPKAAPQGHFGLGLCVSKRVAQRLGGDLTLESAGDSGCRFVLTLRALIQSPGINPPRGRAA
ncbi:MAG TPA: hybrid sensor histidine kinase/response regulator [Planctomycetota bacterium]|nr:hybrid sensor histidine kinase/response regulator [Planctomycetota bacterium]